MSELRGELQDPGRDAAEKDAPAGLRRAAGADIVASAGDPVKQIWLCEHSY